MLEQHVFDFLKDLEANNNREWFLDNRETYDKARNCFVAFCDEVLTGLKRIQSDLAHTEVKQCILRINRDIRFSKDKSPYKNYFAAGFGPGGRSSGKVDFYLQVRPNDSFVGAGMWSPDAKRLAAFRQELDYNPESLKSIIHDPIFKKRFPVIHGSQLKTKPKGYDIDHPEIDLLRYKELFFTTIYSNKELKNSRSVELVVNDCAVLKPYQDYLNGLFFEEPN